MRGINSNIFMLLFIAVFSSRISIVVTNNEMFKKDFFGNTIIEIKETKSIENLRLSQIKM